MPSGGCGYLQHCNYMLGNITSPFFRAKNSSMILYLLKLPLASTVFKLHSYNVFARIQTKRGNVLFLLSGLSISKQFIFKIAFLS